MTHSATQPSSPVRVQCVLGFVPLAWTLVALLVQLGLLSAVSQRLLPETVELYLVGKVSSGPGHYSVALDTLVMSMWVGIALCVVASVIIAVLASVKKPEQWIRASVAVTALLIAAALGLLIGSLVPQLGPTVLVDAGASDSMAKMSAMAGIIAGVVLGLLSATMLPNRLGGRKSDAKQSQ